MGKGILNKWVQLELLKATKDFLLWYIFSGGSIGWCGMSFLHGAVIDLRRDWMQACEGLVCGKFSILPLMVFRRTLWVGWWVLRINLRRVFIGRGLVGCGLHSLAVEAGLVICASAIMAARAQPVHM